MTSRASSALALFSALALSAGCSSTVAGSQADVPDASGGFPDAGPQPEPDAAPQPLPCVEGDSQVEDGSCYMLFNALNTWQASQAACLAIGATLVVVSDAAEQTIVAGLSANFPVGEPDLWIGATDEVLENSYLWVDGTTMIFDAWRANEPNNGNAGAPENCVVIEGDTLANEWDDRPCTALFPYICERTAP